MVWKVLGRMQWERRKANLIWGRSVPTRHEQGHGDGGRALARAAHRHSHSAFRACPPYHTSLLSSPCRPDVNMLLSPLTPSPPALQALTANHGKLNFIRCLLQALKEFQLPSIQNYLQFICQQREGGGVCGRVK